MIKDIIPGKEGDSGRRGTNNRLFVNAVIYVIKNGIGWRRLPKEFGKWSPVWKRFDRWGVWKVIFDKIKSDINTDFVAIDSTSIKVHRRYKIYKKTQKNWN